MSGERSARKYPGVFRRERSPYWWIKYTLPDGRVVRESTKSTSIKEAIKLRSMRVAGVLPLNQAEKVVAKRKPKRMTLGDFAAEYLEVQKHLRSYESLTGRVANIVESLGDIPLEDLSARDYEKFRARRMEAKKAKPGQRGEPGGCKAGTVNRELTVLKHMMGKAHSFGYVSRDAIERIRAIKKLREEDGPTKYLSKQEETDLLRECKELAKDRLTGHQYRHLHPVTLTALRTGMRKSEILGLKWDQVNLEKRIIHVVKSKSARRRDVPIADDLYRALKALPVSLKTDLVFWRDSVYPRPYKDVFKSFKRALKRAGISPGFRFHDCRHHFASWFVMNGGNIVHLQKILGHQSITMTMRYAHLAPSFIDEARRVIDGDREAGGHTGGTLAGSGGGGS